MKRCIRSRWWRLNATDTHSEYVILLLSTSTMVKRARLNITSQEHCITYLHFHRQTDSISVVLLTKLQARQACGCGSTLVETTDTLTGPSEDGFWGPIWQLHNAQKANSKFLRSTRLLYEIDTPETDSLCD